MKLTDTQTQILAAAAEQQDRLVKPPAVPPGPRGAIEAKLRTAGLIELIRLDTDEHPAMAWRHTDGEAVGYRITGAGLESLGAGAGREADLPAGAPRMAADAVAAPDAVQCPPEAPTRQGGLQESARAISAARVPRSLRAAALEVLTAWDAAPDHAGLNEAIGILRGALAGKPARQPRDGSTLRKPREGTKQQQVLALLRREEGATIAQVIEATGWQAHTVRGFFAGLKTRQGIAVKVAERIRQVGPGKEGAKGSFNIYRIADAG
jgi:hypothetical protein